MIQPRFLGTERDGVILKRLTLDDAPVLFDTIDANREHLSQYGEPTSRNNPTLDYVTDSIVAPDPPDALQMGIWDRDEFVGVINATPGPNNIATIGYWVAEENQKNGYATIATRSMAEFARGEFRGVQAQVAPENNRSKRVLARSGFMFLFPMHTSQGIIELFHFIGVPANLDSSLKSTQ
ncbi:MAG: GCN5-related protein N-acetyltransferase [Candidatus Saccharibacteria bacterium]|nr:GCN5-related protein N-acetyltransferase [Candidatus Saccharibacteria bacterium]